MEVKPERGWVSIQPLRIERNLVILAFLLPRFLFAGANLQAIRKQQR